MTPADWEKIQAIVDAALDLPPSDRAAFLERACADAQLRRRARPGALIDAHDRAGNFLDAPIAERASELLAEKSARSIPAIAAGQDILGYRVLSEIGSGGMGVVVKAEDPVLQRPVALKLLAPERLGGASMSRLIREARAASSLNHPNIVTIHGVLQSETIVAIVMEFVDGHSLREICAEPLPYAEATPIVRQIALALAAAHEAGIIHRDVKPENVVVRSDGYIKVVDFGLARNVTLADSVTSKSITAGTLRYMSPEQLRGERLTPASDMFSLGLILYEITSGKHPFAAGSALDTAWAITHQTPAPPSLKDRISPPGWKALSSPCSRRSLPVALSARELASSLQRMEQPPPPAPRQRERLPILHSIKRKAVAAASGVVLILIVALWWRTSKPRPAAAPLPGQIVRAQGLNDPVPPRHVYAIDPQGRLLVYVDNSPDSGGYKNWIAERAATPPIEGVNWAFV